jgi:hypothetical protein
MNEVISSVVSLGSASEEKRLEKSSLAYGSEARSDEKLAWWC